MVGKSLLILPNEEDRGKHRFWLIIGIDTNHKRANNAMGYIKVGDSQRMKKGISDPVYQWWFDLDDLDKLGRFFSYRRSSGQIPDQGVRNSTRKLSNSMISGRC